MNRSSMLVHPSLIDTSPNSIYEAMLIGLPVIASNVGGIPYMLKHGETGILVEPGRPDLMAEQIIQLYKNPKRRIILGCNAKREVKALLNPEEIIKKRIKIYRDIISREIR
jgi:glycosyltransferase involved in cell wall biosynthesis